MTITTTSSSRTITVQSPEAGQWKVRISGSGKFALDVRADSLLQLDRFDFVTLTGRLVHLGFGTIDGAPESDTTEVALADVIDSFAGASFRLISTKGKTLETGHLFQGDPDAAASEFIGSFTIPKQPFRVAVSGTDASGKAYQRVFPRVYTPTK